MNELKRYNYQLSNQVEEMEMQVKAIQAKIKAVYADNSMEGMKYHLHSICVHDGGGEGGHYYTYIYDRHQDKWRKYNDITTTEVPEEEVFTNS